MKANIAPKMTNIANRDVNAPPFLASFLPPPALLPFCSIWIRTRMPMQVQTSITYPEMQQYWQAICLPKADTESGVY